MPEKRRQKWRQNNLNNGNPDLGLTVALAFIC